jgi:glycosyltransferase involved in cell wall biosynthesis
MDQCLRSDRSFDFGSRVLMLSLILPAHNEEALVGRTVDSIREAAEQVGEALEVIVVNDASMDATEAVWPCFD